MGVEDIINQCIHVPVHVHVSLLSFLYCSYCAFQTYTNLNLVSQDSLSAVTSQAERIIMEKTPHLLDHTTVQVKQ